jgi:hypothetical protein
MTMVEKRIPVVAYSDNTKGKYERAVAIVSNRLKRRPTAVKESVRWRLMRSVSDYTLRAVTENSRFTQKQHTRPDKTLQ